MLNEFFNKKRTYFIVGIGGISMSAIAKYLKTIGNNVLGYDAVWNDSCAELSALGIDITDDKYVELSNVDVLVYSEAFATDFIIVNKALNANVQVFHRAEFLYEISKNFSNVIAVAGCHGKTTVSSLLINVFSLAAKKFTAHIGGIDNKFSNYYSTGDDYFITEACEYKKSFLYLRPDIAIVLNTDFDHLECYNGESDLLRSYDEFLSYAKVKVAVYDYAVKFDDIVSFGFNSKARFYPRKIFVKDGKFSFNVFENGVDLGRINSPLLGRHNVLNVLAVVAVSRLVGIEFSVIKNAIENFCGIKRRFEDLGNYKGARCVADYAHHPNEIAALLHTVKTIEKKKLYVIFQPHTYSRTRAMLQKFVSVLSRIDNLIIYKTYPAREYYDDAGSALTLSKNLKKSCYASSEQDLRFLLRDVKRDDLILVLGAGDIYDVFKRMLRT